MCTLHLIDGIAKLKADNHAMYKEATGILATEETTNRQFREKYGTTNGPAQTPKWQPHIYIS